MSYLNTAVLDAIAVHRDDVRAEKPALFRELERVCVVDLADQVRFAAGEMDGESQTLAIGHVTQPSEQLARRGGNAVRAHDGLDSTTSGTVLHYVFNMPAPYGFWSLPKLFGVPGGILMVIGTVWLAGLKLKADRKLGDASAWGGEMAFILLLFLVAATGLLLYLLGGTSFMLLMLTLHLGSVLSFFLLTPFTKMAHAPYRLAALVRAASVRETA